MDPNKLSPWILGYSKLNSNRFYHIVNLRIMRMASSNFLKRHINFVTFIFLPFLLLSLIYYIAVTNRDSKYKTPLPPENDGHNKSYIINVNINSRVKTHLDQDDDRLIPIIKEKFLYSPPTKGPLHLSKKDVNFGKTKEQQEVYRFINQLLEEKSGGFYVECGALDGEFFSNSLPFETKHNWTGLLVEPDPKHTKALLNRNRRAWVSATCLSPFPYPTKLKLKQHKTVIGWSYLNNFGGNSGTAKDYLEFDVQCFPLYSLLKAIGQLEVDYFSLDIEGAELEVLKTIPWDKLKIKTLSVEVSEFKKDQSKLLKDYMISVGYNFVKHIKNGFSHDHIFLHSSIPY